MKETYEKAKTEIIEFRSNNVITTSGNNDYIELPEHEF